MEDQKRSFMICIEISYWILTAWVYLCNTWKTSSDTILHFIYRHVATCLSHVDEHRYCTLEICNMCRDTCWLPHTHTHIELREQLFSSTLSINTRRVYINVKQRSQRGIILVNCNRTSIRGRIMTVLRV